MSAITYLSNHYKALMLADPMSPNDPYIRDYMCQLCGQKFSTMEQLDKHSREIHPRARIASQRT